MNRPFAIAFIGALITCAPAHALDPPPEHAFVAGTFALVGRGPDGGKAYSGKATIGLDGSTLVLTRTIGAARTVARGALARAGDAKVLRFAWKEGKLDREMVCQFGADLDNYPRLTCLWGVKGNPHKAPGIEALFSTAGWDGP